MNVKYLKTTPDGDGASEILDLCKNMADLGIPYLALTTKDIYRYARRFGIDINKSQVKFIKNNYYFAEFRDIIDELKKSVMDHREKHRDGFPLTPQELRTLISTLNCELQRQEDWHTFISNRGI